LKVMPGDRFTIDAQSYYEDEYTGTETIGNNDIISSLMSVLGGGSTYAGVPINELSENARTIKLIFEAPNLAEKLNTIVPSNYNAAAPKAHLNYLFFDDNLQLVADLSGKIQVSPNGAGTSGWQTVGTGTEICNCTAVAPGSSGYIAIYVDNQSLGKKVWFDDLHIEHYTSEVLEEDHYYPFGLTVQLDQNTSVQTKQPYKLTTKELETAFDLNIYDFGARMQDMQLGRWWGVDPLAEKYYSYSPYNYCLNNPIKFIDPDGREVWINYGKDQRVQYKEGKLYNQDGSTYEGNVEGFLQESVNALSIINAGNEGASMLSELQNSKNVFTISAAEESKFKSSNVNKAFANQITTDPNFKGYFEGLQKKGEDISGGSGGQISWNSQGTEVATWNGGRKNASMDLAHEMFHALDANRGQMDDREKDKIKMSEWQAIYRENVLRNELNMPIRTHFRKTLDRDGNYIRGQGVKMITNDKKPILPDGYKP
jgi:RHS repeat-associated protein